MKRRVHPLTIALGVRRYAGILLLPVVREGIRLLPPLPVASWETLLFNEIVASIIILALSVLQWLYMTYTLTHDTIVIRSGVLFRRTTTVCFADVATAELETTLLLSLFDARRLHLDTLAGSRYGTDVTLLLSERNGRSVLRRMGGRERVVERTVRAGVLRTAVMAAAASNAVTGLIFAIPLIGSIGRFIGEDLQSEFFAAINWVAGIFVFALPQLSAVLLVLLFFGQFIAFARILWRSVRMRVVSGDGILRLRAGFFGGFRTVIHLHLIYGLDFRQSILERLFGVRSVVALTSQNLRGREEQGVLFPAVREGEREKLISEILPGYMFSSPMQLRPPKRAWFGFAWLPMLGLVLLIPAAVIAHLLFSEISPVISLLGVIGAVFFALRFAVGMFELREGGAAFAATLCVFVTRRGLRMHTLRVRAQHVRAVSIVQNPFQRKNGRCHLRVTLSGEGRSRLTVRHVDRAKALSLCEHFFREQERDGRTE